MMPKAPRVTATPRLPSWHAFPGKNSCISANMITPHIVLLKQTPSFLVNGLDHIWFSLLCIVCEPRHWCFHPTKRLVARCISHLGSLCFPQRSLSTLRQFSLNYTSSLKYCHVLTPCPYCAGLVGNQPFQLNKYFWVPPMLEELH